MQARLHELHRTRLAQAGVDLADAEAQPLLDDQVARGKQLSRISALRGRVAKLRQKLEAPNRDGVAEGEGLSEVSGVVGTALWSQLGCPTEPGSYEADGKMVRVDLAHIQIAKGHPQAVFTLIAMPPIQTGPTEYRLGSRRD